MPTISEVRRSGIQTDYAAARCIVAYHPPCGVPDGQPVRHRLEDAVELLGSPFGLFAGGLALALQPRAPGHVAHHRDNPYDTPVVQVTQRGGTGVQLQLAAIERPHEDIRS